MSSRSFSFLCLVGIFFVCLFSFGNRRGWFEGGVEQTRLDSPANAEQSTTKKSDSSERDSRWLDALDVDASSLAVVGDIVRPARDIDFGEEASVVENPSCSPFAYPGRSPLLVGDENSQVAGLFQELQDSSGSESAKSTFFRPEPFDSLAYSADPQAYLNQIRPARAFHPAHLARISNPYERTQKNLTIFCRERRC